MDDATIKLLSTIHEHVSDAKTHQEYLEGLILNPITPPAMVEEFKKMHMTFNMLSYMLTRLNEHNMEVTDQISKLVAKIEAQQE